MKVTLFFLRLNNHFVCKIVTLASVLLLALAVAAPVLLAGDGDHEHGKGNDRTGIWTQTEVDGRYLALLTFHEDATTPARAGLRRSTFALKNETEESENGP